MPDSREQAIAAGAQSKDDGGFGSIWHSNATVAQWVLDAAHAAGLIHYSDELAARMEAEIRPLIDTGTSKGGYDCCGCSTYDKILDHAIRIVRGA